MYFTHRVVNDKLNKTEVKMQIMGEYLEITVKFEVDVAWTHWGIMNCSRLCITVILLRSWAVHSRNNHQHTVRGYQATKQYALCYETGISLPSNTHTNKHGSVCAPVQKPAFWCDARPNICGRIQRRRALMWKMKWKRSIVLREACVWD